MKKFWEWMKNKKIYKAYLYDGVNITIIYKSRSVRARLVIFNCNTESVISLFKKIMLDKSDYFVNEDIICKKNSDGSFILRNPNWADNISPTYVFQCLVINKKSDIKKIISSLKRITFINTYDLLIANIDNFYNK